MKVEKIVILILSIIFCVSCDSDEYEIVTVATPELMSLTAFRSSSDIKPPKQIDESGKIYSYNNYVFVNDVDAGIHIIDNLNPESPSKIAFINIIANKDMEIKGDYLYADSLMDLLVFDISDKNNIREVARLENVFPSYIQTPFVENLVFDFGDRGYQSDKIIIGWNLKEERRLIEDKGPDYLEEGVFFSDLTTASTKSQSTGQGGSLARFKIVNEYLYAVDSHNINIFDIQNLESPKELNEVYAGFDIETIFNKDDKLFLGSMSGMYVYDITMPAAPEYVSEFKHGTACDPVVVDDKYAYITLRAGNFCGAFESSLQIVDISDLHNLELVKSYEMDNPYGLGIKNNLLFICDGTSGLKVYDKTNIQNLKLLNHFKDVNSFDVIPTNNHLLLIGDNTLFQYNYSFDGLDLLSEFHLN